MIDKETVKKLAELARIEVKADELDQLTKDLQTILDYVEALKQVPTEGLPEVSQVTGLKNILRADTDEHGPENGPTRIEATAEELLARAPATEKGYVKVKAVFED